MKSFKDEKVAIVGMGVSNQALCRYLLKEGASITCFDKKTEEELGAVYDDFSQLNVQWSLGQGYLDPLPQFPNIFLTPGMKKNQPQIIEAKEKGAFISTEIALFLHRCKATVAGITGSSGKTTTAMLAASMLKESRLGKPVLLGGNIGSVLIEEVDDISEDSLVILELSSFQLQLCDVSPNVSLLLNIRPNHLDVHESFAEYADSKKKIFRFQDEDDWTFLNYDEDLVRVLESECPGRVGFFSVTPPNTVNGQSQHKWAFLDVDDLIYVSETGDRVCIAQRGDLWIPGLHNISNALGAILVSSSLGASPEGMRTAIRSFRGLEHRIEYVREVDGVKFYNDSIATSPDRTIALLETINSPLVVILGGYDKGLSFNMLADKIVEIGAKVVLLGACSERIEGALHRALAREGSSKAKDVEILQAKDLEEAVLLAKSIAVPGSSVVLSPACASYDMFANFEERGRAFKNIVNSLN